MKKLLLIAACCLLSLSGIAQITEDFKPNPLNRPGVQYPMVNSQGYVRFSIKAPEAQTLSVSLGKGGTKLTKGDDGVWTGTTALPEDPGFHYYHLYIDGVKAADPATRTFFGAGGWESGMEIPAPDSDIYALKNVPHGAVQHIFFHSPSTNSEYPALVYTPPTYGTERANPNQPAKRYPVLYLQHGYAENETSWANQGHAGLIMDNLIAAGKIEPFIIVMTYGMTNEVKFGQMQKFDAKEFETLLVDELIPYIDSHFLTLKDRSNRALAGLSMGGMETKLISGRRPETFGAYGLFSGGTFTPEDWEDKPTPDLLFISCGSKEFPDRVNEAVNDLKDAGYNAHGYVSEGTAHEFLSWRRSLYEMAQLLFKPETYPVGHRSRMVEEGGQGPYKAIMKEVEGLKAHTVFCPKDLSAFNKKKPLPVLVWGNGACTNSPWEHYKFLNEIASHGFLVLATGYIPMDDSPFRGEMSTTQQQIESIDWAFAQNADKESEFYQKIDTKHICVAGMSCGGLQALFNCADPRISTLMICNSGLFSDTSNAMPNMPMPDKSKLQEIHTPIIYILGGETDIAYGNGMDDFHRINHVPACAANYPVGHGGTYRQPHGGEFTVVALDWLKWQLKGDKKAAKTFTGNPSGLSKREGWTLEKNKLMK